MPVAYVGAAAGLASTIGGLAGGGSNQSYGGAGGGSPYFYQPTGQPQQDQNYQNLLNNMYTQGQQLPQQTLGQESSIVNNQVLGGQYQTPFINAAAGAGQAATNQVAPMQFGAAQQLYGAGQNMLQQAGNPQSALYNQLQQQTTDQLNAANAASGVSGPYAAGVTGMGLNNFNMDWQNQLLQRNALANQVAGQDFQGASGLGGAGVQSLYQGGQMPYGAYQQVYGNQLQALQGLQGQTTAAWQLPQMAMNNMQSYMGLGQSAGVNALAGQNQGFNQNLQLGQGLGYSLGSLGSTIQGQTGSQYPLAGLFSGGGSGYMGQLGGASTNYDTNTMFM